MKGICCENIKQKLSGMADLKCRALKCGSVEVHIFYLQGLCSARQISRYLIEPLQQQLSHRSDAQTIMQEILQAHLVKEIDQLPDAVNEIVMGRVVLLFSHLTAAISCDLPDFAKRPTDIPLTETVIKGPRVGFTEDIKDNISLLRRRIKSQRLKCECFVLGAQSQTETVLMYVEGLAPQQLIDYVRNKIRSVPNEFVIYTSHVENQLKCGLTPFDTIGYTEKPDVAVNKLAEGRVLILVDGSPFVVTAPLFFIENFQTADDYTLNIVAGNLGRIFRWMAFFLSAFIPGLYLALVTYHFKLVPNIFLYRLALFRAGVPVPTVVELLYMMLFFQIIREGGVRLPQPIGPTLSIVGALILGEAAVTSGLASQVTVVVVAITSIASYLIPTLQAPVFTWSVGIVLLSACVGLPGFYIGVVLFVAHMAGLTSCGYPFLFPFATYKTFRYKDILVRGALKDVHAAPLPEDENS